MSDYIEKCGIHLGGHETSHTKSLHYFILKFKS